jgi:hypothetical protein
MQDMQPNLIPDNGPDREGAMAKADLYKLATYSLKLFKKMQDDDQLEAWVQAKITKAADYMASVYHYLEYEMKFNEYAHQLDNAEITAESREVLKNKLMEAKSKVKELKKTQAQKVDEATVIGGGKEVTCHECGGTGLIMSQGKVVPAHVQDKVEKYKRLTKATHAASKRLDRNNNGIPDNLEDKEVDEEFTDKSKVGDTFKTRTGVATKTASGVTHKNTSYHDDGDADDKSGKGIKSHAKSQSAAEKKEKAPHHKPSGKGWGMKDGEKFDNRDGAPAKPKKEKEKEVDETYGQGIYEAADKKKCPPMSHVKKMCQDGKSVAEICKMHPDCDHAELKQMVADCKKSMDESKMPMKKVNGKSVPAFATDGKGKNDLSKKKDAKVDEDPNEGNEFSGAVVKAKASGAKEFKVDGKTFPVKEALKGKQKNLDVDDDGDIEGDDLADLRAGKKKKVDEAEKQTMSRAAKGHEKYGKEGMAALAKAGKEGKSLEPVRAKYNKYDETMMPQNPDGATAPPPKGKDGQYPIITSGPNKGKRWSPTTPGPTNPAFNKKAEVTTGSEMVAESADITRIRTLMQRLNG